MPLTRGVHPPPHPAPPPPPPPPPRPPPPARTRHTPPPPRHPPGRRVAHGVRVGHVEPQTQGVRVPTAELLREVLLAGRGHHAIAALQGGGADGSAESARGPGHEPDAGNTMTISL